MRGIDPRRLHDQVENTACWADVPGASAVLADVSSAAAAWELDPPGLPYFRFLLAAHFMTVATFVPTDVDARIRHHTFVTLDADALGEACDIADEAAVWDVRLVSARTVERPGLGVLSGHAGEWFSVRAGALGRAVILGNDALVQRLTTTIDEELDRERRILAAVVAEKADADILRASTTIAHNLGDLSRVIEAWPNALATSPWRARYTRLGHAAGPHGDSFMRAGTLNKALMADENHRFLALRKPRALRTSRDLLLPIGPFFDAWGCTIATHPALTHEDRAEVVAALLAIHDGYPKQLGCLRALAGIDTSLAGGLFKLEADLPARMRRLLSSGPLRDALKTSEDVFVARLRKRVREHFVTP